MNNAPNIRIEVTEGAQIPDPRDRRLLNAWTLAFCVAVVALVTLCATQPEPYLEIVKFLPDGLIITFEVTVLSLLCTLPIGLLTGLGRLSRNPVINLIASTYVEIIRGVPLLVQLFYIYYALGRIIQVPPMVSAVIAISFCYGAYMGEVFRAGILSVPKGQTEAARSLGFNNFQTMTLVILPQAMRTILPPIGNESPCSRIPLWSPSSPWPTCCAVAANSLRRPSTISRPIRSSPSYTSSSPCCSPKA